MRTKTEEAESNNITPHYLAESNTGYKVDTKEQTRLSTTLPTRGDVGKIKGIKLIYLMCLCLNYCIPLILIEIELVFKLRIAYSTDTDFIEVEIERSELNYQHFLVVCCSELGLNSKYVERLRKLPNTRLRKNRDVQRLRDFEVINI